MERQLGHNAACSKIKAKQSTVVAYEFYLIKSRLDFYNDLPVFIA